MWPPMPRRPHLRGRQRFRMSIWLHRLIRIKTKRATARKTKVDMIEFIIPGQPVAKGRPKFSRHGANVIAYTPEKTASYENLVKIAATMAMRGREPSGAPISLAVSINLQIPARWSGKRRSLAEAGVICATKKPDADNVLKGIKDGCNGIVWRDDAQVVLVMLHKRYSATPSALVRVVEVVGESA